MEKKKTIKGNAPYLSNLIGFKSNSAFGKAMAKNATGTGE